MFYVYVLYSLSYNSYYTGSTGNLEKRLNEHNSGMCRYTSGRMPWQLVYKEEYLTRSEAVRRERFFKSGKGREQLKLMLSNSKVER